jgi:hypothetical protein
MSMIRRLVCSLAALGLAVAACQPADSAMQTLTVSAATRPVASTAGGGAPTGGSLTFSSAQVVVTNIALAPAGTACAASVDGDQAAAPTGDAQAGGAEDAGEVDCEPLRVDPVQIDLPLDASTEVVLDALVPAGSYTGLHAKLGGVTVAGVYTDPAGMTHPFTFTSIGHAVVEIKFPAPVTVGPATSNVTITVDVASWFTDASGAVLDPTNPANVALISQNIRRSFRAFADNNHDGADDAHEGPDGPEAD